MKIKNKNYTVEILRFIFAIDIALFHYRFLVLLIPIILKMVI